MAHTLPLFVRRAIVETSALFAGWPDGRGRVDMDGLVRLEHAAREWILTVGRHASFTDKPSLRVGVEAVSGGLICTIVDNSDGLPCRALSRPGADESARAGLFMMRLMADHVSYRRGVTRNSVHLFVRCTSLNLSRRTPGAPAQWCTLSEHLSRQLTLRLAEAV